MRHSILRQKNRKIIGRVFEDKTLQFDIVTRPTNRDIDVETDASPVSFKPLKLGFAVTSIAVTDQTMVEMIAIYMHLQGFSKIEINEKNQIKFTYKDVKINSISNSRK